MIVLDTTVLLYAVGTQHRFREPCRTLVQAIHTGQLTATTTIETIQEFTHVRARRRDRSEAADLGYAYLDLLSPLLIVEEAALREGIRLFTAHDGLGAFDAVLAAATLTSGASALVSTDAAFSQVAQIRHIVPDDAGVRTALATDTGLSP